MIQYNLTEHMRRHGLTNANQLRHFAKLTTATAYNVLSGARLQRIEAETLEALAKAFDCHPGDLLEYTPE